MQIIEFRAWDKERKQYIFSILDYLLRTFEMSDLIGEYDGKDRLLGYTPKELAHFDIEQFTCIFDKNCKKIYAGDILGDKSFVYGFVYYDTERAQFMVDTSIQVFHGIGKRELYPNAVGLEVIGNIHENPELIKAGLNDE